MWNKIHCKTNRSLCRETLYFEGSKCKLFNITEDSIIFELESLTTTVKQWTLDKTGPHTHTHTHTYIYIYRERERERDRYRAAGPHIYYQLAKFLQSISINSHQTYI